MGMRKRLGWVGLGEGAELADDVGEHHRHKRPDAEVDLDLEAGVSEHALVELYQVHRLYLSDHHRGLCGRNYHVFDVYQLRMEGFCRHQGKRRI